jgi:hypothetical protein
MARLVLAQVMPQANRWPITSLILWTASANRGFEFQKSRQLFPRVHNKTLFVTAMHVCNPDRSPVGVNR